MITEQDFRKTLICGDCPKTLDGGDEMKLCKYKELIKCYYWRGNGGCANPEKCKNQIDKT